MKRIRFDLPVFVAAFLAGVFGSAIILDLVTGTSDFLSSVDEGAGDPAIVNHSPKAPSSRFEAIGHGCGNGYVTLFVTDDGINVSEGKSCGYSQRATRREFNRIIGKANKIIERDQSRAVLAFDAEGLEGYEIIEYVDGPCVRFIEAPTLELALELEEYLNNNF
jgi:hypothetical protein